MRNALSILAMLLVLVHGRGASAEFGPATKEELLEIDRIVQNLGLKEGRIAGRPTVPAPQAISPRVREAFAAAIRGLKDATLKSQLAPFFPSLVPANENQPKYQVVNRTAVLVSQGKGAAELQTAVEARFIECGAAIESAYESRTEKTRLANGVEFDAHITLEHEPGKRLETSNDIGPQMLKAAMAHGRGSPRSEAEYLEAQAASYARGGWYSMAAMHYGLAAADWKTAADQSSDPAEKENFTSRERKSKERAERASKLAAGLPDGGQADHQRNLQKLAKTSGQKALVDALGGKFPAKPGDDW